MRLLWYNLATDEANSMLAFTPRWIEAVARHVEAIDVVTMTKGEYTLPDNVRVFSVGKEKGYSEARRVVEFYRIVGGLLMRHRYAGCFSHMMPLFTILGAPLLALARVPVTTWYAHLKLWWQIKAAHRLSRHMVASVPTAYPYRKDDGKFVAIGQGIDTSVFAPDGAPPLPPQILSVGRISRVKDQTTLVRAVARLRDRGVGPFRVTILGEALDAAYAAELHGLIAELGLGDLVSVEPNVRMEALPALYRACTIHVNLTPTGSGDKVAWESMACGRPCVYANEGFDETVGSARGSLYFPHGDASALADRLSGLLSMSQRERDAVGEETRRGVERLHSLDRLARRILDVTVPPETLPAA